MAEPIVLTRDMFPNWSGTFEVTFWKGSSEPGACRFETRAEMFDYLREQQHSYFTQTFRVDTHGKAFWHGRLLLLLPDGTWKFDTEGRNR